MDRLIDKMSEEVTDDYEKIGLIEDINEEDRSHLQKYARNSSISINKGRCPIAPCVIILTPSGSGCNILTVYLSKRPGSKRA